jgi:hypothetical protein
VGGAEVITETEADSGFVSERCSTASLVGRVDLCEDSSVGVMYSRDSVGCLKVGEDEFSFVRFEGRKREGQGWGLHVSCDAGNFWLVEEKSLSLSLVETETGNLCRAGY